MPTIFSEHIPRIAQISQSLLEIKQELIGMLPQFEKRSHTVLTELSLHEWAECLKFQAEEAGQNDFFYEIFSILRKQFEDEENGCALTEQTF